VNKIITFHGTVRSAASFTSKDGEGIHNHLQGFQTYHVNGAMRAADRDNLMQEFRDVTKAVMSNARCLTEGVDVPAVDMVAFLVPKRSRVDIVQATGRAMRKSDETGKTIGYVFLPLFVEEAVGESVEEAVARSEYEEVWNVLQAVQEQDEVLADTIREMREAQGRTGGFDDSRFRERVQIIGPAVSLNALRNAITMRCIERLAASWDYIYGKLAAFKDTFGHCRVPEAWEEDPPLGTWVLHQRRSREQDLLSPERIQRLDALGFEWDPRSEQWEEVFARLVKFKERVGHCRVPEKWKEDPRLGTWVTTQRAVRTRDRLSLDRIQRLDALGFEWDPISASWEEMFDRLVKFKERVGHCQVPTLWKEDPRLGKWVAAQRRVRTRDRLSLERIQRLDALGFEWDPISAYWEEMFARLVKFKERVGHCRVPQRWKEDPQLAGWVSQQRTPRGRGRLSPDILQRLEALGFEWDPFSAQWEEMFARLVKFKERAGHCQVPGGWKEDPQLAKWVERQRRPRVLARLSPERTQRLDSLDFQWNPKRGGNRRVL